MVLFGSLFHWGLRPIKRELQSASCEPAPIGWLKFSFCMVQECNILLQNVAFFLYLHLRPTPYLIFEYLNVIISLSSRSCRVHMNSFLWAYCFLYYLFYIIFSILISIPPPSAGGTNSNESSTFFHTIFPILYFLYYLFFIMCFFLYYVLFIYSFTIKPFAQYFLSIIAMSLYVFHIVGHLC